jgi:hypothetical protein
MDQEKERPKGHPSMITRRLSNGDCRVEKYSPDGELKEVWVNGVKQPKQPKPQQ